MQGGFFMGKPKLERGFFELDMSFTTYLFEFVNPSQ